MKNNGGIESNKQLLNNYSAAQFVPTPPPRVDLAQVMLADPSLIDGYRVVFERKCLFEINLIDPEVLQRVGHEISEPEELLVKILVKGPEQDYTEVKVELFS